MRVVYDDNMVAPAQGGSPSAAKPAAVVAAWRRRWPGLEVRPPVPVSRADLYRAHDNHYVDAVLDMVCPNGFGTLSDKVTASLFYTSGALLTAARWAANEGGAVAAPVSGFHHAGWSHGVGFCTFNGLMVTALALQAESPGMRIGILDYDYHYGDGTENIIEHVSASDIVHISAGEKWHHETQAEGFLQNIAKDLHAMRSCDLVLYQAGADAHVEDPLGGFLTTRQLAARDWAVFDGLQTLARPVAWDLAGGYQRPLDLVVGLHVNSMAAVDDVESSGTFPFFAGYPQSLSLQRG